MPERRNESRRGGNPAVWLGSNLWAGFVRRPVDMLALLGAVTVSVVIVVNAVFLQSHSRPAPFIANPAAQTQSDENRSNGTVAGMPKAAEPARRNDPIAELISASVVTPPRLAAVQRILSQFGYGQIKPTGLLDGPTSAAIEKFETEHKLPVTGRLSDRLLAEMKEMTGHPVQ